MDQPQPFPWRNVMEFGFGVMHLSPKDFWSLTVPELQAALEQTYPNITQGLERSWLRDAMTKYPDKIEYSTLQRESKDG